jgi:hypothetical protein
MVILLVTGFDNHEQKLAQDSLKQSEIQFRMMAECRKNMDF